MQSIIKQPLHNSVLKIMSIGAMLLEFIVCELTSACLIFYILNLFNVHFNSSLLSHYT